MLVLIKDIKNSVFMSLFSSKNIFTPLVFDGLRTTFTEGCIILIFVILLQFSTQPRKHIVANQGSPLLRNETLSGSEFTLRRSTRLKRPPIWQKDVFKYVKVLINITD